MEYDHFEYGLHLSDSLLGISHFLKASSEQDPVDMNQKISELDGCVLISVDGKDSEFGYSESEMLNEQATYCFLVINQTEVGNPDSVYAAQRKCKRIAKEIVSRMMLDYGSGWNRLGSLFPESFQIHGVGPFGDNFHGVALSFAVGGSWSYELDETLWKK